MRYAKNKMEAEDVMIDGFMMVYSNIGQFKRKGSFEGWIRRITVHTVTDYLRKKIRDDRQIVEIQAESVFVAREGLEQVSFKELLALVHGLPDTQRTVFNLFVFENYSHKEIAELLGLKENNCRWHLNDARNKLKDKLKHYNRK